MAKIVRLVGYFPGFVNEEENKSLIKEATKDELKEVIHIFQKVKSPRLDSWSVEFFLGPYYLIGKDILSVVEEYRLEGHIHAPLYTTFNALILKSDSHNPLRNFDQYCYVTVYTKWWKNYSKKEESYPLGINFKRTIWVSGVETDS